MTSGIRSLRGAVAPSTLRVSTAVLLVGLVSGPTPASAEDVVLKWNDIAARTAVVTSPFNQARVMAIVQLSVFEAVNAITGEYEPYLDPATAAAASVDAAVIIAAHRALTNYFPAATVALNTARAKGGRIVAAVQRTGRRYMLALDCLATPPARRLDTSLSGGKYSKPTRLKTAR